MSIGAESSFEDDVLVGDQSVENFPTLKCELDNDVGIRITRAARAFSCLKKSIFTDPPLISGNEMDCLQCSCSDYFMYGSE